MTRPVSLADPANPGRPGPVARSGSQAPRTLRHGRVTSGAASPSGRPVRGAPSVRTCVGCRERAAKSSLLRLVAAGDLLVPDPRARLPGRGAYLHLSQECLELAQRRRAFPRALRARGPLGAAEVSEYLGSQPASTSRAPDRENLKDR
ncbi:MAG: YlxR family protein [Streptosporangiaceae bacterium]